MKLNANNYLLTYLINYKLLKLIVQFIEVGSKTYRLIMRKKNC